MSTSEGSSNTSSSATHIDDASSTWWDMGATVGVLAAIASSSSRAGRRGGTHDMAIFRQAMNNDSCFLHPPQCKYYLVDSGYPLREGYMAPYRKNRYHLPEFMGKVPVNLYEIFNYHHSFLRSVVERSFGVLKSKWQILKGIPLYHMDKQSKIIVACFVLHNFALENNQPDMDLGDVLEHLTQLHGIGEQIDSAQGWLAATADDDIGTVRDWIAAGLYGLR